MRVTVSAATFLAWVSAVMAQTSGFDAVLTPAKDEVVAAGSTYTITWDYSSAYTDSVSIQLLQGSTSTTLQLGDVIASGIDNSLGQFSWTVDSALGDDATYGLKIIYSGNSDVFQYSNPFQISKADTTTASSSTVVADASSTVIADASSTVVAGASTTVVADASTTAAAGNPEEASSTVFSTEWLTVTSCAATVTDCPARSTVTSSTVKPVVATVKPSTTDVAATGAGSSTTDVAATGAGSSTTDVAATGAGSSSVQAVQPSAVGASSVTSVALPKTTLSPSYPIGNSTSSAAGVGAIGTVTLSTSTTGSAPTGSSSAIATAGAGRIVAGSVALVAGLMAAMVAL